MMVHGIGVGQKLVFNGKNAACYNYNYKMVVSGLIL